MALALACTNSEKVKVTCHPVTADVPPKPAPLDGPLQGEVVSGDGSIAADPSDPNSVYLISGDLGTGVDGLPSRTVYRLFGDADTGSGVKLIEEPATLDVGNTMAASFGFTSSAPEPK